MRNDRFKGQERKWVWIKEERGREKWQMDGHIGGQSYMYNYRKRKYFFTPLAKMSPILASKW